MSISSFHSLQTQIDSESMPMSNDHQSLPGDPDFFQLTQEDVANLVSVYQIQSDKLSPELLAQWDELFNYSEELRACDANALAGQADANVNGSNYDEVATPQQLEGTSSDLQYVQDPQASFPTLENFTAPVTDLPHPMLSRKRPPQGDAWPQHEYGHGYFMNGPPGAYHTQPSAAPQGPALPQYEYHPGDVYYSQPSAEVQAPLQGHAWPQHGYHPAPSYPYQQPQTVAGPYYPYQQPQTIAGPSNTYYPTATFPQGQVEDAPLQTVSSAGSSVKPSSSALDETASAKPRKRKSRETFIFVDCSSSSYVPPTTHKRRRQNGKDHGISQGKFGPYTLADASATIMVMPVHDPKPVDISSRRTHDPHGNPLRTRRFGVMELDDSYPSMSDNVTTEPSSELICRWTRSGSKTTYGVGMV
ncbi:hypothetical protein DFJ58DRAFT_844817 [Suillus subalutaceus]|uniref:uncharacterized protein n=1 Tax=Suillus subalutaceus TaxID=48586 RepID=UPI001B8628A3|nr:uncharacterized protein DFJ58DRAFT_844817 [Suillus subalutaceus]KAG1842025.1 hypothetical protein DFJ58DRAFT_844817 [Suillus subalutaceus]